MVGRFRYEINVLGYRIRFVDRGEEVEALTRLVETGSPVVEFVYGPEGCGKSTLLRCIAQLLSGRGNLITIYLDALEHDLSKAILGVSLPKQEIAEALEAFSGPLGAASALLLTRLIELIGSKLRLSGKTLAIFVDDPVKALGVDKSEAYVKWLYELIYKVSKDYNVEKTTVLATSSEGLSRRKLVRHTYLHISLLWNLPYHGFTNLVKQLPKPSASLEKLWILTGGNPRAIVDLALRYSWNIDKWLKELKYRLAEAVREVKHRKLDNLLGKTINDPDILWENPEARELAELLEKENLVIYKYSPTLTGGELRENTCLGIGKYYAWQIPAYREALKRTLLET